MKSAKQILMLGTRYDTMGGISAVVNVYREAGFFEIAGIRYIATHTDGSRLQKACVFVKAWLSFVSLLISGAVKLVHVRTSSKASFWRKSLFFMVAFLFRKPTILHLHSGSFDVFYEQHCGVFGKWFVEFILNRVSAIVVLSGERKDWIHSISSNSRVIVLRNPVHMKNFSKTGRREPGAVLCLGRLGQNKGTYVLLEAIASLCKAHPELKLWLGGDGELERVKQEATRLGISDRVEVLGWVCGAQKEALLHRASIYALPSYAEGMPVSVLEAMAAGLPIVSTPVGGIPSAVTDGTEGRLVQPGNIKALADALHQLLADDKLRSHMGELAKEKIQKEFTANAVLPLLDRLYADLISRPR